MQDVLHAIDSRYRTIARRSGRGLGARDLRHILVGAPAFDRALTAHGVHHEFEVDHGGHVAFDRVGRDAVPFFARTLEGARATAPLSGGGG